MPTKTYGQMCPVARSLDVLGERWTLLIVRELLLGPKRFKHLLSTFPSLGANRLSSRLQELEAAGVLHKVQLPEPAEVTVYELTARGEGLREPVLALGRWGLDLELDPRIDISTVRAELIALALTGLHTRQLEPDRTGSVQFDVDDEVLHLRLDSGRYLARSGPAPARPVAHARCALSTFLDMATRAISPTQAELEGRLTVVSGSRTAIDEVYDILVYEPSPAPLLPMP
jgi:DNA-binding HxlR family transcriptional regulator